MAFGKRGTRSIVVDGRQLRWTVHRRGRRGCPHCDVMHIIVGADNRKGSFLLLSPWELLDSGIPIKPSGIAAWVRLALADGWSPGSGERDEPYRFRDPLAEAKQMDCILGPDAQSPRLHQTSMVLGE